MVDQDLIKDSIWESTKETFETMVFLPVEKVDGQDNPAVYVFFKHLPGQ